MRKVSRLYGRRLVNDFMGACGHRHHHDRPGFPQLIRRIDFVRTVSSSGLRPFNHHRPLLRPAHLPAIKHSALTFARALHISTMFRAGSSTALRVVRFSRGLATLVAEDVPKPALKTRHDWTKPEIKTIYESPLLDLVFRAASVHRQYHDPSKIQLCTLMNIKSA